MTKQETEKENIEEEKKIALALITTNDEDRVSNGIEGVLEENFSHIPDYQLYTKRAPDLESIFNYLKEYSSERKIDTLILAYHGSPSWVAINREEDINPENAEELLRGYSDVFAEDATVLLHSCYTGGEVKEGKNVAESVADAANVDVMAPRYNVATEYSNFEENTNEIFSKDEKDRIVFNEENFVRIRYNTETELLKRVIEITRITPRDNEQYIEGLRKDHPEIVMEEIDDAFLYVKRPR